MNFSFKSPLFIILLFNFYFCFSQNQDINVPESGNLGSIALGSSASFQFTIENTFSGGNPKFNKLIVSSIAVTGTDASDFTVSGISLPTTINRSSRVTFNLTFTPSSAGSKSAQLSITSDDSDENPYLVDLTGSGDASASYLTLLATYPINVLEPSGLAFDKTNNRLFTVSDNTGQVMILSTNGTVIQTLAYAGSDLEGVSMYKNNKILIAVEGTMDLVEYDYVNDVTVATHSMNYQNYSTDSNSRIEGVTYDSANDEIYFVSEKNPGLLLKADGNFNVVNEYVEPLNHGGDYSATYYVEETGNLWIASDQTSTIYKCTTNGTIIDQYPVTTSIGATIDKLEGIAIDYSNQLIYGVSDGGQELYVFGIDGATLPESTPIEAVLDTFPTLDGINGETTSISVLDNDTFNNLPATLAEVSLHAVNPIVPITLNSDGTITVLPGTSTTEYYLTYEICDLADPFNCSQATNVIYVQGTAPAVANYITAGDSWKYYDLGNEPTGSWESIAYDDSTWSSGNAVLGFNNGQTTTLNSSVTTAYFRKTFDVTDASSFTDLDLSIIKDDGMVVYVNGAEVWRDNMPSGTINYSTEASSYVNGSTTWMNQSITSNLVEGTNVVAVEVHIKTPKGKNKTPDMSFDFELTAYSNTTARLSSQNEINNEIVLFPVPSKDIINIKLTDENEEISSIEVYSNFGVKVLTSHSSKFNVRNLKSGIYFVNIKTTNTVYKKVISVSK